MGIAGILQGWALRGYSAVGRCKKTLRLLLVTAGMFCDWALQRYSPGGHYRETWRLSTAGTLGGWALQGHWDT